MEGKRENKMAAILEPQDYANACEDRDPITPELTVHAQEANGKAIFAFRDEKFDVFSSENGTSEKIWTDSITNYRSHSLGTCLKGLTYKWLTAFEISRPPCRQ